MFQRYGGLDRVSDLVMRFYDRVLGSERLAPFFQGIDMRRLVEHQAMYISAVMGGPASFSDTHLHEVHSGLGIGDADFDEMLAHFRGAMEEKGFAPEDTEAVMRRLASLRRVIVSR
jgi:hemoglobin